MDGRQDHDTLFGSSACDGTWCQAFPDSFRAFYHITLHPAFPATAILGYLLLIHAFNPSAKSPAVKVQRGRMFTGLVVTHNVLLAIYSLWTFIGAVNVVRDMATRSASGLSNDTVLCDRDLHAWVQGRLGYFTYWFYLSKYYEFLDSVILILKGRRVSLLQSYHHAGVVVCLYLLYLTRMIPAIGMVGLNSWVHAWMYTYYAVTALGYRVPGKRWLTRMQITQFCVGISLALWFGIGCGWTSGWRGTAVWFNVGYLVPLTSLFIDFSNKTYGTSQVEQKPQGKKE